MSDTRPRVRHLVKGLGPGGAERLLVAQVRSDTDPTRFAVAYRVGIKRHLVPELHAVGVEPVWLGDGRLRWILRLRRLLLTDPTPVLHSHSPAVSAVTRLLVRTLPRRLRPALVGTEHNRWPRHHRLTRAANRLTIRLEAATIAVSDDVASTIRGARPGQVRTIVHGIDLEAVRATADRDGVRRELGIAADDTLVVCVANLRREKALDELVQAATQALTREPRLRYLLVGQGPLAAEVDRWVEEAGIGDRFTALGYRDDATRVLSAADVFTLSSHHEGLPVAVMEALALGVPVAATAAGGVPAAAGAAGIVVPIGDPDALAAAHVELATDSARRSMLAAASLVEAERFSIRRAAAEIESVYDTVTSESGSSKRS